MKKITLILLSAVFTPMVFSQAPKNSMDAPVRFNRMTELPNPQILKSGGNVIWSTTFDWKDETAQQGWSLPAGWNIGDYADLGNNWTWRDDTLGGLYTSVDAPAHFATPQDGFICVPMDEYNSRDGVSTSNVMDTYIMTPPINCSSAPSVMVKFNQEFRLCCSDYNIEMLVTNDGGVHWASYEIRFGIRGNTVTPDKFHSPEINISDVAAGLSTVQIKFYIHGMARYYMMIDDLQLVEAYNNDLVLADTWTDFNAGFTDPIGHVNYLPFKQIGMDSEVEGKVGDFRLRGAFLNNGMMDQEDVALNTVVLLNGEEYFNQTSSKTTIWPLERDTLNIAEPFRPEDYGDYRINFTAVSANSEEVPANNASSAYFTVNDTLYQRADFSAEAGISSGAWVGGGSAGDVMAVSYDVKALCEINSISAYLTRITDADGIPSIQFVLFKYMAEDDDYAELLTSDIIDFDSTLQRTRITLPLGKDGESEFLQPGEYLVGVRSWGNDGTEGLDIGWDLSTKFPSGYSVCWQVADNEWAGIDKLTMIGFNINEQGGPTEAPVTFNVDMNKHILSGEFNPDADFVDVAGTFNNWNGSGHLTDPDGDGIYTITVDGVPVGQKIEFKYRINGNPGTSETTDGPGRQYTVRYWNILNHVYNGGITAGIPGIRTSPEIRIYPNPSAGRFTVEFLNPSLENIHLMLTDIQGKVLYFKDISPNVTYRENLDISLPKGLYLLKIQTGSAIEVQKIIIQ